MNEAITTTSHDLGVPKVELPRVVVVGGGFGGLEFIKRLKSKHFQVVLLDRKNFHTFQPLLYQVATAGLEPASIVAPFRAVFKRKANFHFRMAELLRIDVEKKQVETTSGTLRFDSLVLCHGATTDYFGNREAEALALPMKSIPDALSIRSLILENLELALVEETSQARRNLIDVVIVGAGPTGVELAGAFAELKRHVLPHDYPDLRISDMDIHLVEAGPAVLSAMSEGSRGSALQSLRDLGVHVHLNNPVERYDGKVVTLKDGTQLGAGTLIWSAGIRANEAEGLASAAFVGRQKRIKVDARLRVNGTDGVYALGDVAAVIDEATPNGHAQVAPVAMQQARLLADNFERARRQKALVPFRYRHPGSMATIGRNRAVVELGRMRLAGIIAWLAWMFVHLMALVGFRNRFLVFLHWTMNYLTYDRSFRLVFRNMRKRFGGTY
jgi:NADH:ubiquinone reductase (H+-translocating)